MAKAVINLQKESGGIVKISSVDGVGVTELVVPESGNLVSVGTAVTDNAIARYDGTIGKLQNSGVVVDDSGNVGVGVTPSAWATTTGRKAIDVGSYTSLVGLNGSALLTENATFNGVSGSGWVYRDNLAASYYEQSAGSHVWHSAPSGTAGNTITWTNAMTLDANGNLLLTSGTGALGYGAGAGGTVTQLTSKSTAVALNKPCGRVITHNAALAAGASVFFILNNNLIGAGDVLYPSIYGNGNYEVEVIMGSPTTTVIKLKNTSASSQSEAVDIEFKLIKGVNS